jgi:hypothetical protein
MSRVSPPEVSVAVTEPRALLAAAVVAAVRPAGCANALTPRQGPASRAGRRPAGLVGADMLCALLAAALLRVRGVQATAASRRACRHHGLELCSSAHAPPPGNSNGRLGRMCRLPLGHGGSRGQGAHAYIH